MRSTSKSPPSPGRAPPADLQGKVRTRTSGSFRGLLPLFQRERAAGRSLILATVIRTAGPTYTKTGELMLITESGEYAGLISGGCLEGDLADHGRRVLMDGRPKLVRYDMRGPNDLLFGLGSGCEGAMDILLQRLDAQSGWEPMTRLMDAWKSYREEEWWLVVRSEDAALPLGSGFFPRDGQCFGASRVSPRRLPASQVDSLVDHGMVVDVDNAEILSLKLVPAPHVLLLGAGPDALPVAQMADFLGWQLSVIDHRDRYASANRFRRAELVLDGGPAALVDLLAEQPRAASIDAALVMSHHFLSDQHYLSALAASEIPYVGLLGPVARRERLLAQLGAPAARLRDRLYSPVGLDLGAETPEGIALAIAAEILGHLRGRERIGPQSQQRVPARPHRNSTRRPQNG